MARPFRFTAPDPVPGSVLRDRVQTVLAGRFDRRVTALVAGAGFGKTTAMVQAFEENRLAPLGADLWLACEPDDADPWKLVQGLAVTAELGEVASPDDALASLVERIGTASPSAVCLVLDDVQFLTGSDSVEFLDRLIDELPANGHLVLCGRRLPEVAITRLELIGEAQVVGEDQLAFDHEEVRAVLGVDHDVGAHDFGGWPALIRLAESGRANRFVDEEILQSLSSGELDVVRTLAVLGESDVETLDRLLDTETTDILDALPLVHRRGASWAAHDLWGELLAPVEPEVEERMRRAASGILLERGRAIDAVDVLAPLPRATVDVSDAELGRAMCTALVDPDRIDPTVLRRWIDRWPEPTDGSRDAATQPAHLLLRGLVHRLDNPGDERCQSNLRAAAERFHESGDDVAAVASLSSLVYAYHVRRDVEGLMWAFGELQRFADAGVASARPFPLLGGALVATAGGTPDEVLDFTEQLLALPLGDELRAITLWLHATALGDQGRDAVEPAAECHAIGLPLPGIAMIHSGARWRAGHIRDSLASPTTALDGDRDRFLTAGWGACLASAIGDVDAARRHLAVVEEAAATDTQWKTPGSVLLPTMTVRYAEERLDDARAAIDEFIELTPADGRGRSYRWFGIGAIYTLAPDQRDWYERCAETEELGPLHRRDLSLVRAFVAVDEAGDEELVRSLDFPDTVEEMMPSVGLRNGATLLAAAVGLGRDDVDHLLDDLVDLVGERARERWRTLSDHPVACVADGARRIVESLPVPPPEPTRLSVLGGTELWSGAVEVDHPDWRRERVRALLTYLVLHREATREQVMAALWPDASESSARRSLRTTLNMLHDVVEPQRRGGDAPFFVRSIGQRLVVRVASPDLAVDEAVSSDGLLVDVNRFERLVDDGDEAERRGTPSRSVEPYLAALETYRGDLLPDCYDDWAVFERDRLRSRAVAAGVRSAELLVALRRVDEAVATATRVLNVEPWSEPAHRALIAAHLEGGDVAAARRSLDTCERVLAELGGPTEDETLELTRRLARR